MTCQHTNPVRKHRHGMGNRHDGRIRGAGRKIPQKILEWGALQAPMSQHLCGGHFLRRCNPTCYAMLPGLPHFLENIPLKSTFFTYNLLRRSASVRRQHRVALDRSLGHSTLPPKSARDGLTLTNNGGDGCPVHLARNSTGVDRR